MKPLAGIVWSAVVLVLCTAGGSVLLGCSASERDPDPVAPDFAEIDLAYEGCSCFEEVRELKLISRRLFGVLPEVDEDRQVVRLRIREPRYLPLSEFARAVDGTHAMTRSLTLQALVSIAEGQATLQPTGQTLVLGEATPTGSGPARRRLKGTGWRDPLQFRMSVVP